MKINTTHAIVGLVGLLLLYKMAKAKGQSDASNKPANSQIEVPAQFWTYAGFWKSDL